MILADTNVLVYTINTDAPQHTTSQTFIEAVQQKNIDGVLLGQVLLESYAVVTDHRRVAKPLEPETAWEQVNVLRTIFPVIDGGLKSLDILKEIGKKLIYILFIKLKFLPGYVPREVYFLLDHSKH